MNGVSAGAHIQYTARLGVTHRLLAQEPSLKMSMLLIGSVVFTAYALPLRIIWCRVQPLLVFALLVVGSWTRRYRTFAREPNALSRDEMSTYERVAYDTHETVPHWDEALYVYAAWLAYGALFHEAKHAAADLELFDDTWMLSATAVTTLRALFFTAMTCYAYTHALVERSPSFWTAFAFYAAFLFVWPPLHGVPQALAVHETLARAFAFLVLFAVSEYMRGVVDHWYFAALVRIDRLDPTQLQHLQDACQVVHAPVGDELPLLVFNAEATAHALPWRLLNLKNNRNALPVSWSVLRSAWILTLPNVLLVYFCLFVCVMGAMHSTYRWSAHSVTMLRAAAARNGGGMHRAQSAAASAPPPTSPSKAATAAAQVMQNAMLQRHQNRQQYTPAVPPSTATAVAMEQGTRLPAPLPVTVAAAAAPTPALTVSALDEDPAVAAAAAKSIANMMQTPELLLAKMRAKHSDGLLYPPVTDVHSAAHNNPRFKKQQRFEQRVRLVQQQQQASGTAHLPYTFDSEEKRAKLVAAVLSLKPPQPPPPPNETKSVDVGHL